MAQGDGAANISGPPNGAGGNPTFIRQGHTTDGEQGSDPSFNPEGGEVRDLTIKGGSNMGGGR